MRIAACPCNINTSGGAVCLIGFGHIDETIPLSVQFNGVPRLLWGELRDSNRLLRQMNYPALIWTIIISFASGSGYLRYSHRQDNTCYPKPGRSSSSREESYVLLHGDRLNQHFQAKHTFKLNPDQF